MPRSKLSLITAAILFVCAAIFLMFRMGQGVVGMAIAVVWLLTAAIQHARFESIEPFPASRLVRRFARLIAWFC